MVATTNTSRKANPNVPPFGVLVSGLLKNHRNARYGNSDTWNRSAARSLVIEDTDHAETSPPPAAAAAVRVTAAAPGSNIIRSLQDPPRRRSRVAGVAVNARGEECLWSKRLDRLASGSSHRCRCCWEHDDRPTPVGGRAGGVWGTNAEPCCDRSAAARAAAPESRFSTSVRCGVRMGGKGGGSKSQR